MSHLFRLLVTFIFILQSSFGFSQNKPAYVIYSAKGKEVSYKKLLKAATASDIILFGELHNNAIAHWLELELTKDLARGNKMVLGAEMLEADNQEALDLYLQGKIDQKGFDSTARLWSNYKTDYAPLVDFAKENQLRFIATNIPRRFASQVYKMGFVALDSLKKEEKSWVAPLPIVFDPTLPEYQNILTMMGDHGTAELVMAQASKDATMAHFILANYSSDSKFLHFNGAYHSNRYEGIVWYLKQQRSDLSYLTISTVTQEDIFKLSQDNKNLADFIICVDEDVTNTY